MTSKNDILTQATLEYEAAKRRGDKAGTVRAHAKADRARGAYTKTVVENGAYKQKEIGKMSEKASSGELLAETIKLNSPNKVTPSIPLASSFRNAPAQTSITPERQAKNQQIALQELQGKQGNIASFARGASLSLLDPFSLRKLTPYGSNPEQERASAQNTFSAPIIKNPRAVAQGLKPAEIVKTKGTYEGLGELAGSMVGVDPVGIGITKGIQKGIQISRNAANKIPVLVNGKVSFVDVPTNITKNTPAPTPRIVPKAAPPIVAKNATATTEVPRKYPAEVKPEAPPQAPVAPVQPRNIEKGMNVPKEQAFAQNGLKSVGADTFKGEKPIDQLVNEYGAIPKGEMPRAREIDIPKKTDYGETQQYARTLQESAIVDDALYKDINDAISQGSFTKPTKSNKTAVEDANVTLEQGLDEAVSKFKSVLMADKQTTSYDIALGNRVLQELQKSGRYDEALNVAIDLSEMLSETGRTLQAARIAKRLSPEGRLMIASRTAQKVSKKTGTKINLSDDTIRLISEAKTEKEVVEANQRAAKEIWDQVPANWVDKVNSWRYMAMLFNPKTHARNIVGNSIFLPVREFKNLIGAGLERAIIKDGTRTKAVMNPLKDKALMEFASNDFKNVKSILKNEGKLDDNIRTLEAKVFNTRIIEGVRKLNLNALDAEDTWFMKFAYDSSLAQYMKANKLTPDKMVGDTLESARSYAMDEALKATYRDFNALANLISRGKANLSSGKYGIAGRVGGVALEGMVPFAKTPLNIIKRGLAYSPANLARGMANLAKVKSGKVTATEAIDQLASGLSGTALLALGTYLGYNNIVKGKEGEYKDKTYNYNQMLGSQNYSLNIDGNSYTLDWAAPLSMPFFVGVEISNAIKDNNADLATVIDSMTQISDPMVNLSMLKGINDIMTNNFEGLGQTAMDIGTGYAGQYNPTLFGQIARTADDTRRSTISTAETGLGRAAEKFGRKQIAKIPLASKTLEPYVDLWGREQKSTGAVENFLSPGYFKKENITPVDEELLTLTKNLDEETAKKILPASTAYQYTIEASSETYRMTEQESTAYQKTRGQESFKGLGKLFTSEKYKNMTKEEKVKAVNIVYDQARETAKMEYLKSKNLSPMLALPKPQQEKYAKIAPLGVKEDQYLNTYNATKGVTGVKDDSGNTIRLSESFNKKQAIDKANPGASPAELRALYHVFDVSEKVW
jgi:hypothetical protein